MATAARVTSLRAALRMFVARAWGWARDRANDPPSADSSLERVHAPALTTHLVLRSVIMLDAWTHAREFEFDWGGAPPANVDRFHARLTAFVRALRYVQEAVVAIRIMELSAAELSAGIARCVERNLVGSTVQQRLNALDEIRCELDDARHVRRQWMRRAIMAAPLLLADSDAAIRYIDGVLSRAFEPHTLGAFEPFEPVQVRIDAAKFERLVRRGAARRGTAALSCPICLDDVAPDQPRCVLGCGHGGHVGCMRTWLTEKCQFPVCPHCRARVDDEDDKAATSAN